MPLTPEVIYRFDPLFDDLSDRLKGDAVRSVATCLYIHKELFALLREEKPLDVDAFERCFKRVGEILKII